MIAIPLTLGVEEEYQIIDPKTHDLTSYIQEFLETGKTVYPEGEFKAEFLQSQVEVGSKICRNIQEVRQEIIRLRRSARDVARHAGLAVAAASTHPFANWTKQEVTAGIRYKQLMEQMQGLASQMLIFGFHIHVGFGGEENNDLKIDVMNQLRYFLPHLLALSTSSPFWQGRRTGLKSYRSVIFEMLPRTGVAPIFHSFSDYHALINLLAKVGSIERDEQTGNPDGTRIWWDIRPHPKFGTLEVRISDICTKIDEAVCIAALLQSICHKLIDLRKNNQSWRVYSSHQIAENKWRAMRYGIDGNLIDFGREQEVAMRDLALELMSLAEDSARELGCWNEVRYIETILNEGTSADRQLKVYDQAIQSGRSEQDALNLVVDHLIEEYLAGY